MVEAQSEAEKNRLKDMPEETAFDGTTQTHGTTLSSTESSAQEPSQRLGESPATAGPESSQSDGEQNGQAKATQGPSRYERTKRERAAFKAAQAQFAREREQFARERAEFEASKKPKRDYSIADLRKYRQQWQDEGNFELVEKADKEIAVMEAEEQAERAQRTVELPPPGTQEHRTQWEAAERELFEADPEFMREGTKLDTKLREIMASADGNIYRQHPRGIVAAYHRAKMELMEEANKGLQTENSNLKTELQRYQGLTSVGGGAPGRIGSGNRIESIADFEKLSAAEMRKHLTRGAQRDGVPWF